MVLNLVKIQKFVNTNPKSKEFGLKGCYNNLTGNLEECYDGNPYQIFALEFMGINEKNQQQIKIISPVVGRCWGYDENHNLVYTVGCGPYEPNMLTYDKLELIDNRGKCVTTNANACDQFLIEKIGNVRIFWNTIALMNSYPISLMENIPIDYTNQRWIINKNDDIKNYLFKEMLARSTGWASPTGGITIWRGYRSTKKKLIWVIGNSGVGKSKYVGALFNPENSPHLDNPIYISYDNPLDYISEYIKLTDLQNFSDIQKYFGEPIIATDKTIAKSVYGLAGDAEERLKKYAFENDIDIISEKANYPTEKDISSMTKHGYEPYAIFIHNVTDNETIKRKSSRFQTTKRFGNLDISITKSQTKKWIEKHGAMVKSTIIE